MIVVALSLVVLSQAGGFQSFNNRYVEGLVRQMASTFAGKARCSADDET